MTIALIVSLAVIVLLVAVIILLARTQAAERRHLVNVAFSSSVSDLIALDTPPTPKPAPHSELYQRAVDLDNPIGI